MSDDDARLDEVAAELLALPPARFTAARNDRAAEGGAVGRRIAKLRKPTVAAWAVNLLVRDGQLGEAVELSRALHEAQDDLDAAELGRLGRQRRQLVAALARRAGELAAEAGTPLSAAMSDAVEKTVNAAVVDETVAAAVLTGRLVSAIDLAEMGDATLAEAVAGSVPEPVPQPAAPRDDLAARRARKAAERAVREAEGARADAERENAAAGRRVDAAAERSTRARERVEGLRADLARAEKEAAAADDALTQRRDERARAEKAVRAASEAVKRAEAARDERTDR
ncbi:transposase [uncultured Microbacterium sp.]|uniref:transposase n=1 Tax=uncultured Microbacterium sp. TaxID=191216 RepID=UPI0025F7AC09|nr:transposase [uncultured Microbacterium sp.]